MLKIPKELLNQIISQGKTEAPDEACGYLAGSDQIVSGIYPMTNIDHSPEHFTMSPVEQFRTVKEIRSKGLKILAVYHSHPSSPARMSKEDIRLANDVNLIYMITSLSENQTKCFKVNLDKKVLEIPLEVI